MRAPKVTNLQKGDRVVVPFVIEAKGSKRETVMTDLKLEGSSGKALRQCIAAVRRGGPVSVPGVHAGSVGREYHGGPAFRGRRTSQASFPRRRKPNLRQNSRG